ncbi:MAG: hypothetical protein RML36_04170 [Anaerolineae bacterium]|nr:hypothetical protein [Anaerolineae bacterium]MDW8098667.1 hypothetical protein [Anaerolineae bacterium]
MSRWDHQDRWIALILAISVFGVLFATERTLAVGWDEPVYAENGQRIILWLGMLIRGLVRGDVSESLNPTAIGLSFGLNHEHPPLAKAISGLGWALTRNWLPLPTAHRVGPMALSATLAAWIYVAVRQAGAGRIGALVGALALLDMPRLFFHAHVAGLDLPAAALWFFAVWVFWRLTLITEAAGNAQDPSTVKPSWSSLRGFSQLWTWIVPGLAFGLALATKISNVLASIGVVLWVLASRDQRRRWDLWGRLILMGPLGLLTLIVLFPWFWSETGSKLINWARFFTVSHYEIYQYYLGKTYLEPPWHFPIVTVLVTVPVPLLALAAIGAAQGIRPGPTQLAARLWLIQALLPVAWFMRPSSRAFDGDRLLMPTYVFLAPLVGLGFDTAARWLSSRAFARTRDDERRISGGSLPSPIVMRKAWPELLTVVLGIAMLAPGALAIVRLHPFELAYYNEAIGGVRGAHRLQLETIYWASTYRAVLPELNRRAAPGATVWVMPNSWDVMYYYQKAGLLRDDLVMVRPPGWGSFYDDSGVKWTEGGMDQADFAIVEYRQTTFFDYVVDYMAQHQPVWTLDYQGVPLVALYQRSNRR